MSVTISGSGQIIKQVIQTVKTDTFSMASTSFTAVTGLSATITPTNASNKILVVVCINITSNAGVSNSSGRMMRDSTPIFIGDAASTRPRSSSQVFSSSGENLFMTTTYYLDSPATTSPVTYSYQVLSATGGTMYVNRTNTDRDAGTYDSRVPSSITVMEVAYA